MASTILKYKCELCNKCFAQNSSRNRHIKEQHLKPNTYHCEQCESRFSKKYNLQVHIKQVHSKNRKQIKCSHCNLHFIKPFAYNKHFKEAHECSESNISLTLSSERGNETDAQSIAQSALKEIKQLQLDIQSSTIRMTSQCFENVLEITRTEKSVVQVMTIKDNLYPLGSFKLLKTQTITRADGKKYFICEFCSKEFRKTYNFLRHRRIHTKVRPFACVLCEAKFSTIDRLKTHCSIHKLHEQFGLFHKLYKCPKCDQGFSAIQQFDTHISSSSDCKLSFKCPKCFKEFRTLKTLLRHKHSENDSELGILKAILPAPLTLSDELHLSENNINSLECNVCGMQIKEKTSFKRHENLFRKQCDKCEKPLATKSSLSFHKKQHMSDKNYRCQYCNDGFHTPQSCRRHMAKHFKRLLQTENDKDTICYFPALIENEKNEPATTATIAILESKKLIKAREEKVSKLENFKYKCSECGKAFRYNSWLKKHFKYKHTNELPFECSCCCRKFRTKQSLESHLFIHSTKRLKLTCQVCGRQYSSSKSLKLHLRIHTQETPFSCKNCGRQFRTSGHLIQHCKSYH